jgi:putative transposase
MMILKAYQYKLLPTLDQRETFAQWAGCCRYIYNLALEQRKINWKQFRLSMSYEKQCNELTHLKKHSEVEWLRSAPSQCLQQSLKDLDRAFKRFFTGVGSC